MISKDVHARPPRTCYTVGRDAALTTRLPRFVSDRTLDRLIRRTMGL